MPSFAAKAKEKGWGVEAITREALHWRVAKGMQAWWAVDKCSAGAEGTTTRQAFSKSEMMMGSMRLLGCVMGKGGRQAGWAANAALGEKLWRRGLRRLPY